MVVKAPSTIFARVLVYVADCIVYLVLMPYNFYSFHILLNVTKNFLLRLLPNFTRFKFVAVKLDQHVLFETWCLMLI